MTITGSGPISLGKTSDADSNLNIASYLWHRGGDFWGVGAAAYSSLGTYRGRSLYNYGDGSGGLYSTVLPSTNLSMSMFYGLTNVDEWNCACACNCGG